MMAGQTPYRDFLGIYGPMLYLWTTFWYRLLGADWFAALCQLEVISPIASLALIYLTAKEALDEAKFQALFVAACALIGLDHFFWAPALRIWIALAAWAIMNSSIKKADNLKAAAAGLLCGSSFLFSAEAGIAAALGCGFLLISEAFAGRRRFHSITFAAISAGVPALIMTAYDPSAMLGYFRAMKRFAAMTNWFTGLPLHFPFSLKGYCFFAPFLNFSLRARPFRSRRSLSHPILLRHAQALAGTRRLPSSAFYISPFLLLWTRLCMNFKRGSGTMPRLYAF